MSNYFDMRAGDSRLLSVLVCNPPGEPTDITGAGITWKVARNEHSAPIIEKSTGAGIEITGAAEGIFEVTLEPADTADLKGDYFHQAKVMDGAGNVVTVVSAWMIVRPVI